MSFLQHINMIIHKTKFINLGLKSMDSKTAMGGCFVEVYTRTTFLKILRFETELCFVSSSASL